MRNKIFGILLMLEAAFMLLASLVALYYNIKLGETDFTCLLYPSLGTGVIGFVLLLIGRSQNKPLRAKDSFLIVTLAWVLYSLFGMVPFMLYGTVTNVADAFFETMSGFTTTGATVLSNIDSQPHGILFWRSLLQWLGGLGIIVFSLAFFSSVAGQSKKMFLFSAEASGLSVEKLHPTMQGTARDLWLIYLALTISCMICYWIGPMSFYDALCHSLTTISTGGYSTHQSSIGYFQSSYIEYVAVFFMIASGANFSIYYFLLTKRFAMAWRNKELKTYLLVFIAASAFIATMFIITPSLSDIPDQQLEATPKGVGDSIRTAMFHVASIFSSTGYQAQWFDYDKWGIAVIIPTVLLMICGACTGSTTGGIKIIRVMICRRQIQNAFKRFLHPTAYFSLKIQGQVISFDIVRRVFVFMFLYLILYFVSIVLLTLVGMGFDDASFAYFTCFSNCGPGLRSTGPANNFANVPDLGKWLLSIIMLIGRLEIFTVLVLFTKGFWKSK